ncbi:C-X-C chemokine receptor type 2-like isoform X2 [Gadus macrocephalus]|uniref:C-X-C chemokine receptor type 2-like isoform X2 n=1 Tax=Gadus macrocephalus TaxID=80720 RepID=UPI0028CBBAC1|nr:C-X-C chemokine receptor type 2-like isoform X2 [Gadus macrocephalus]
MGGVWRYSQKRCCLRDIPSDSRQEHTMAELSLADIDAIFKELNITYNGTDFWIDPITQPCNPSPISDTAMIGMSVFYVLVFLLAIPGNLLVGLVICLNKQPLSSSDLYLLHLAVADILLAVTLPFWATSVTLGWVFGDAMCKMVSVLQELSFYVSILFLACISVDRYLAIVRATDTHKVSRRLVVNWCVCAAVWFTGGLLSLPGLLNSANPSTDSSNGTQLSVCTEHYDPGSVQEWRLATRGLSHTLGFVFPLIVMLLCYGTTMRRLLRTKGGFQRQRAMQVIVVLVVAFLVCWTPYHLAVIIDTFLRAGTGPYQCLTRNTMDRAVFATQSLGLLHSCVNPVLYAFVGRKFRGRLESVIQQTGFLERTQTPRPSGSSSTERPSTIL